MQIRKEKEEEKLSNRESFKGTREGWQNFVGGLVKTDHKKGRFDDEGKGGGHPKGGPRHRNPEALPPAKNEGEKMMTTLTPNNAAPAPRPTNTMDDREVCPACGWGKPKEIESRNRDGGGTFKFRPIVCKACHDKYDPYMDDATTKLAKGEMVVILSRHAYVLSQLDLQRFEQELATALIEKDRLNELVQARINEAAKLQPGGRLSRETFISLRDKLQMEKLPGEERTARDAYAKWRRLDARFTAAKVARPEVEKMVADEATKNAAAPPAPPAAEPAAEVAAPVDVLVPVVPDGPAKPPAKSRKPKG